MQQWGGQIANGEALRFLALHMYPLSADPLLSFLCNISRGHLLYANMVGLGIFSGFFELWV